MQCMPFATAIRSAVVAHTATCVRCLGPMGKDRRNFCESCNELVARNHKTLFAEAEARPWVLGEFLDTDDDVADHQREEWEQ